MHSEIEYSVGGKLQPQELGELLLAAAGSRYSASELEAIIAKSTAYVAARDTGQLVGFGRLLSDGAVIAYINNMAVSPQYQGQGIGKAILERLVETAGNVKSIFLYSDTADQFYLDNGFERSEKRLYVRRRGEVNQVGAVLAARR